MLSSHDCCVRIAGTAITLLRVWEKASRGVQPGRRSPCEGLGRREEGGRGSGVASVILRIRSRGVAFKKVGKMPSNNTLY